MTFFPWCHFGCITQVRHDEYEDKSIQVPHEDVQKSIRICFVITKPKVHSLTFDMKYCEHASEFGNFDRTNTEVLHEDIQYSIQLHEFVMTNRQNHRVFMNIDSCSCHRSKSSLLALYFMLALMSSLKNKS